MPACDEALRANVGRFFCPVLMCILKRKADIAVRRIRGLKPQGRVIRFVLLLYVVSLLERCGDIEKNPGPSDNQMLRDFI
ncbi:hypothetical protein BaRGS_00023222 [Batillaria attramentaria]|uniref:Uncharacterized protein n=1 Tax=Batillaria attramentaria TaxID=370345 RepID=A0ABD0KEK0_9CAEN